MYTQIIYQPIPELAILELAILGEMLEKVGWDRANFRSVIQSRYGEAYRVFKKRPSQILRA
jgi:hypothetical protein